MSSGGQVGQVRADPLPVGPVARPGGPRPEPAAVDQPVGAEPPHEVLDDRPHVPVRVLLPPRQRRELHDRVGELRPAEHHGVLLRAALERPAQVVDDHRRLGELPDQRLEAGGVPGLEVDLDRQAEVPDVLPQRPQLGLAEGRQAVGGVGVDAGGDDPPLVPPDQSGHPVERAGPVGEEQAGPLELAPPTSRQCSR